MPTNTTDIAIAAIDIHKVFNPGADEEVIALQDINLEIEAGEFISLIGPSGCGKSTLMRLIGDLLQPTVGATCWSTANRRSSRGWIAITAWSFKQLPYTTGAA